jgi:acyl-CoA thioester hydrolase
MQAARAPRPREVRGSIAIASACASVTPAYFGDEVEVRLRVGAIGRSSFVLEYEIADAARGQLVASASTVMVSYDYDAKQSTALPDATRVLLERLRGSDPLQ